MSFAIYGFGSRSTGHLVQSSMLLIGGLLDGLPFIRLPNFSVSESSAPDRFLKNPIFDGCSTVGWMDGIGYLWVVRC